MPITPKSYSATASVTIDGTDVTTAPVTIMTGSTHGSLIRTLELSNTGDYDAVAHIRRLDSGESVYADIKVDLEPRKSIILWDEFIVLPAGHVLQLEADSDDIQATVSCHEGFPEPPALTQGYLRVTLSGTEAGQWSADYGTTWHDSGETVTVTAGNVTIIYKPVASKATPGSQVVNVVGGTLVTISQVYFDDGGYSLYKVTASTMPKLATVKDPDSVASSAGNLIVFDRMMYLDTAGGLVGLAGSGESPPFTACSIPVYYSLREMNMLLIIGGRLLFVTMPTSIAIAEYVTGTAAYESDFIDVAGGLASGTQEYGYALTESGKLFIVSKWINTTDRATPTLTIGKICVSSIDNRNRTSTFFITTDGKLYRHTPTDYYNFLDLTQIGTDTDWTDIIGSLGLKSTGALVWLDRSTWATSAIGEDTDWTAIGSGGLALKSDGTLWKYNGTTLAQVGSATNWTNKLCRTYPAAINSLGELYAISGSTATRRGSNSDWIRFAGDYAIRGTAL